MMTEDIRDIKGIVGVIDWGTMLFLGLCLILCLGLFYLAYRYYLNIKAKAKAEQKAGKMAPAKPFNVFAEESILALDPVVYFQKGLFRDYYFELTRIVRHFLSDNYKIDALEKTSFELVTEMERVERDYEKIKLLDRFLQDADLVKFAREKPSLAVMRESKEKALGFIKEFYRYAAG
ncbi:hypothetical protein A3K48_06905 [candidate division WOR-1 bacterium RIFOXYA12_FULL_52_29]|uniref:DUF4129 domain-containing protein n=1 Tax=candidate division WOR-1 bacterium RIFOXYC12_FULL_54_18 TaxID=1802584 RepID=A0A1F4T7I3_UNCSA|nr:MAG: hypothetical protein A3K44_06905 [candidate division WOR-1 bacterium RIFOXYA2_FULL_51_19]OGC18251.1 MAG: hypothetical protein A3K48_06905 [candidate division WOR-1 bacterium RIFOXYA12_FULL_52_29]OGC27106.1 MAG: hypothetical protein A3K32_06900 [candidate division WOR-1 bacterium RIFOXYB2_FULL_45_9]OGC28668.1 MAG: hypothetical protein A3K49_06905 [candidate division WOR-1 bacterium RIFOXYC12_FULL_54_18]OGC30877.1 MAG: hypothetical protein A2346_05715 [candidate division WOR-1 bacterium R